MSAEGAGFSLMLAAASVAWIHTVLGPDHYLPFIMLARARGWGSPKAAAITAICGLGHVVASLVLASGGLFLGLALGRIERLEQVRGSLAAWALVAFGLAYAIWGSRRALRRIAGLEPHVHEGHLHLHTHGDRPHRHPPRTRRIDPGFWSLFVIFVLGPCEPLIPLFVLPASRGRWDWAMAAAVVFGVVTVGTMVGVTLLGLRGVESLRWRWLERWSHALSGCVIAASGLAILVLGL
jgi:threonine/homoserine/homoserine lactone efflux protein